MAKKKIAGIVLWQTPEGFVVYWQGMPIAKMKNKGYTDKHLLITGNLLSNRNIAIDRFFAGTIDDVLDVLPAPIHLFVHELKDKTKVKINEILQQAQVFLNSLPQECFVQSSRSRGKLYADALNLRTDPQYKGFFFQFKEEILAAHQNRNHIEGYVLKWLQKNHTKFSKFWKATCIPEIVAAELEQEGSTRN